MKKYATEYILKLTQEQAKKLNQLSKMTKKPKSHFVRLAIDMFLKRANEILKIEKEFENKLYELALKRLNDKDDEILTIDEFEREIGIRK